VNTQDFFYSKFGVQLALITGHFLPHRLGHLLADSLSTVIAKQKDNVQVKAVRTNQWIIHGKSINHTDLDRAVLAVFRHSGRCIYDMYHYYNNPPGLQKKISLSDQTLEYIARSHNGKLNAIFVGPHLSNFDLCIRTLAVNGMQAYVLSYPNPIPSYQLQNKLRSFNAVELVPMSLSTLRIATEKLRAGKVVLTGVERPIESQKYKMHFFGELAALPTAHIQLALNTGVPIIIISGHTINDGTCLIETSEEIHIRPDSDHHREITRNGEMILERLEEKISSSPLEWLMFYPVWPQFLEQTP